MKKANFKFIIVVILVMTTSIKSYAQITKSEIIATGLTCSMCSNAINKQLKSLTEVDSVATDLNTNTFVVYLKKQNKLKPRVLKERVEKAGFFVGTMLLTMPSSNNLKTNDNKTSTLGGSTFVFLNEENQKNDGETKFKIYDKGYITQKEHKKLLKTFSKTASYSLENEDDYHIKIIK